MFLKSAMNSNRGLDPMLSSLVGDSMWNTKIIAEPITGSLEHFLSMPQDRVVSPVPDVLLSSDSSPPYSDLEFLWGNERKRVTSIKMEEDETFSSSPCSIGEVDSSEIDMEDCDIKNEMNLSGMEEDDNDIDNDMVVPDSKDNIYLCNSGKSQFQLSEEGARKYVEEVISKIAFVPNPNSTHREKIQYILSHSDCKDYTVDDILNLDKRSADSARICANIVQNIPQRYRWECVKPEEIPCCYTIVADCKKTSNRDKPPRPMNAFMIWAQGARRLINELCPKMQNAAISEALGFYWRQKSDSFKKRFELEKVKLRRFHNVEFPHYKYKPKTKVQKAKEKKEQSLSKCKVSKAAIKREKLEDADCNVPRRKSKYGRPRKAKQVFEPEEKVFSKSELDPVSKCDKPVRTSPTKPAIKDMLTLKILNDRRSKEMNICKNATESIQNCLGQLSPLEVENPTTVEIFDELRHYESQVSRHDPSVIDSSSQYISSSVYDTPANTPPIDENDHPISPFQQTPTTTTSFSASLSPVPPQQQKLDRASSCSTSPKSDQNARSCSTSQLPPRETMPSLKAILSSGSPVIRQSSQLRRVLPGSHSLSPGYAKGQNIQGQKDQSGLSTDLMLSYVSEILSSPNCNVKPKARALNGNKNSNNNNNQSNVCDVNNNTCTWQYNSCEDHISSANDAYRPQSPIVSPQAILDFSDLDMLSLDMNVPLLSDDIMKSLLNSL